MAQTALRGNPVQTVGDLPTVGSPVPSFTVTGNNLADVTAADFAGKNLVLNIFPSIDTPTCATSVRTFNQRAADLGDTVVLWIGGKIFEDQIRAFFDFIEGYQWWLVAAAFAFTFAQAAWRARSRAGGAGSSLGDPPPPRPPGEAT